MKDRMYKYKSENHLSKYRHANHRHRRIRLYDSIKRLRFESLEVFFFLGGHGGSEVQSGGSRRFLPGKHCTRERKARFQATRKAKRVVRRINRTSFPCFIVSGCTHAISLKSLSRSLMHWRTTHQKFGVHPQHF